MKANFFVVIQLFDFPLFETLLTKTMHLNAVDLPVSQCERNVTWTVPPGCFYSNKLYVRGVDLKPNKQKWWSSASYWAWFFMLADTVESVAWLYFPICKNLLIISHYPAFVLRSNECYWIPSCLYDKKFWRQSSVVLHPWHIEIINRYC